MKARAGMSVFPPVVNGGMWGGRKFTSLSSRPDQLFAATLKADPGRWTRDGTFSSTRGMTVTRLTSRAVDHLQVQAIGGWTGRSDTVSHLGLMDGRRGSAAFAVIVSKFVTQNRCAKMASLSYPGCDGISRFTGTRWGGSSGRGRGADIVATTSVKVTTDMTTTTRHTKLTPRVNARLTAYTALTGAALAATAATAPDARAAVVYSGAVSINIPTTTAGIYLNVVTGVSNAAPASAPGWDLNPWGSGSLFLYGNTGANATSGVVDNFTGGSSATLVDNLPFGTPINSTFTFGSFGAETTGLTAFTLNSQANYVGFRFLNEATSQVDYGWAQLSLSSTYNGQPRSIIGYAYENTGAPILAGVVPEPTTTATLGLGALTLGAAGVRRWRRRNQANA